LNASSRTNQAKESDRPDVRETWREKRTNGASLKNYTFASNCSQATDEVGSSIKIKGNSSDLKLARGKRETAKSTTE